MKPITGCGPNTSPRPIGTRGRASPGPLRLGGCCSVTPCSGIRSLGVLLGAGTAWQLFRLAQRLYDDRIALWCLALAVIIPMFAIGSIIMTIDSLSVFFWAWAVNLFWNAAAGGRTLHWLLLGSAVGLGFLSKFTNGVHWPASACSSLVARDIVIGSSRGEFDDAPSIRFFVPCRCCGGISRPVGFT